MVSRGGGAGTFWRVILTLGVSKRSTLELAYHFRSRLLGSKWVPPALDFQRSEWTCFLAMSVRFKRMYA